MKQIYLAGPDVFFPDSDIHFDSLEALCASVGLQGRRPSDGGLSRGLMGTKDEIAERIYQANIALIAECDGVLANLMPFRNALEPDSGTVFEVGMAIALRKPVVGHFPQRHRLFEDRVLEECGLGLIQGRARFDAKHGFMVEEFGQPLNLMLARSTPLFDTAEAAVRHLASRLN